MNDDSVANEYHCRYCKNPTYLKRKNPIRCSHCGKSILYKTRNRNNPVQLEAI
ncbi:DNA-directed RNA polymerases I, II, and III subunit RPABC4 [Enteropsectra breve]|nr:DNA-directed RNA polymerases I, II, and III subunit RPABC4 [Enteropsectra breve]